MQRSFTYSALTLRVKPSGESNREAWFLTAEEGILRATVFGGPKSRLRSHVAPFHAGTLWIYHDPLRDSRKVSDFDVKLWRPGIRELWERATTANTVAETVLASHGGGGNWGEAAKLAENALDTLDEADSAACSRIGTGFLWQWTRILGARPDFPVCSSCACKARDDTALWYSAREEALFCEECYREKCFHDPNTANPVFRLGPGAISWLKAIATQPSDVSAAADVVATADALGQARAFSRALLASAIGKSLPTWDEM